MAAKKDDLGRSQLQAAFDEAEGKGYFGETPDETPNADYTMPAQTVSESPPEPPAAPSKKDS
jgi:hypothetical protein